MSAVDGTSPADQVSRETPAHSGVPEWRVVVRAPFCGDQRRQWRSEGGRSIARARCLSWLDVYVKREWGPHQYLGI